MARRVLISLLVLFCFYICPGAEGHANSISSTHSPVEGGATVEWFSSPEGSAPGRCEVPIMGSAGGLETEGSAEGMEAEENESPQDKKTSREERKKKKAERKSGKTQEPQENQETKQTANESGNVNKGENKNKSENKSKSKNKNASESESETEVEAIAIEPRQVEQFLQNRGITHIQGIPMEFTVIDGDTIFLDTIEPAWILPKGTKMKGKDWRRYSKLVFNFNKMYPYALVGREMMAQVDSTIAADVSKRSERNRYINDVEKELLRLFEQDIRSMTVTQGLLLLRLVDRECGMSAYEIIRTYEGGFAAAFWQLVARLFSQNLKTRYNPEKGEDAKIEELCQIWDSGQWNQFYWSIFMEDPPKTTIKSTTLESEVRKKKR